MRKHNIVKVVLITLLVFLVLSWILPAAYYSGEYIDQGRVQMGLFDLFNYPLTALAYFGYIALYVILVGGFYGVLYKIPAYRSFLDKFAGAMKGKSSIWLSVMVVLIALIVSVCGMQFGIALFIPFIVSLILLMGYDRIVAALVTVGSISVGLIGTTYANNNIGILTQICGLEMNYQIGVRFILLLVGVVLVIFNTLMYAKHNHMVIKIEKKTVKRAEKAEKEEKVVSSKAASVSEKTEEKKSTSKSTASKTAAKKSTSSKKTTSKKSTSKKSSKNANKAALKSEDIIVVKESDSEVDELVPTVVDSKHSVWPFIVVFCLLFVVFTLAFIPWGDNGFKISLFDDITSSINNFKLFGFPLFAKVLGSFNAFGSWTITDMFLPMTLAILVLAIIYKVSIDDVFEGFKEGAKKAFVPALIVLLMYTILVAVVYHPFQLVIYKAIIGLTKGFNIATTTVVAVLSAFFNSDISYAFQGVVPYYTSVITNVDNYSVVAIIFQSMYGLTMLVAPTSLALMVILYYLDIRFKDWFKAVWKLLLELFVVLLIVIIILTLI